MNIVSTQQNYGSICNVFEIWHKKDSASGIFLANYFMCYQAPFCKQIIIGGSSPYQQMSFPYTPTPYTDMHPNSAGRLPNLYKLFDQLLPELVPDDFNFY